MPDLTQTVEADPGLMSTDELLDHATEIKAAIKRLTSSLEAIQDELTARVEAGDLDASFTHNDWSFTWIVGRTKWVYPPEVGEIETLLKAAKKSAEANGSAVATTGAPHWTIRAPQS